MPTSLLPCSRCHRHVWSTEAECPFCGCSLGDLSAVRVAPDPPRRMGRAELFAFTAAFLGACQTGVAPQDAPDPTDVGVVRATDAGAATTPDVATPQVDAGGPDASDAAVLPCDVVAPDAGRPRRAGRHPRPRLPPMLPQPCYGMPFND